MHNRPKLGVRTAELVARKLPLEFEMNCGFHPTPGAEYKGAVTPRDYGRFRSGCRMCVHAPLYAPHISSPRPLLSASDRRVIGDSLMSFRIPLPNEAGRGVEGVGRRLSRLIEAGSKTQPEN